MKSIRVFRDGRPASDEELDAAVMGERLPVVKCETCGTTKDVTRYLHTAVSGWWEYICPDCKRDTDPDDLMQIACPECRGGGDTMEGWTCPDCDGIGFIEP